MFSDIATANTEAAEILFLLAAVSAGVCVIFDMQTAKGINFLALAVCLIAVAFLLL